MLGELIRQAVLQVVGQLLGPQGQRGGFLSGALPQIATEAVVPGQD